VTGPAWLAQGCALFTELKAWTEMVERVGYGPMRGVVTISGIRRPDALVKFRR
jgi:hypothetical protein